MIRDHDEFHLLYLLSDKDVFFDRVTDELKDRYLKDIISHFFDESVIMDCIMDIIDEITEDPKKCCIILYSLEPEFKETFDVLKEIEGEINSLSSKEMARVCLDMFVRDNIEMIIKSLRRKFSQ